MRSSCWWRRRCTEAACRWWTPDPTLPARFGCCCWPGGDGLVVVVVVVVGVVMAVVVVVARETAQLQRWAARWMAAVVVANKAVMG
jgi:hypothetical protein